MKIILICAFWPYFHLITCSNCLFFFYKKVPFSSVTILRIPSAWFVWTLFLSFLKRPPFKSKYFCIVFLPLCITILISHIFNIFQPFIEFHTKWNKICRDALYFMTSFLHRNILNIFWGNSLKSLTCLKILTHTG